MPKLSTHVDEHSHSLTAKELLAFYENEAVEVPIFGSLREISLAENIMHQLPSSFQTLLDVGCGEGYLLYRIGRLYKNKMVYGLDLTDGRIKTSKKHLSTTPLIRGQVLSLPFPDNSFDVVVCSELLEHISSYNTALDELIRISKNKIIITVPNELLIFQIFCPKCKAKFYFDGHVNFFTAQSLLELFHRRKDVRVVDLRKFHTIYTYNRLTLAFPQCIRLFFDKISQLLEKKIRFLKPTYLLISLDKR